MQPLPGTSAPGPASSPLQAQSSPASADRRLPASSHEDGAAPLRRISLRRSRDFAESSIAADALLETLLEQAKLCEDTGAVSLHAFTDREDVEPKFAILHVCRAVRDRHEWTDAHRAALQRLLKAMSTVDTDEALETYNFNEILAKDSYQHEMDAHACMKMCTGLLCLLLACQAPWIISAAVILAQYLAARPTIAQNPQFTSAMGACDSLGGFLMGFLIIFCSNVLLGASATLARSVDGAVNACVSATPFLTTLMSLALISFNLYGVVLIWNQRLWGPSVPPECQAEVYLSTAIVCMFLALPCLFYSLRRLLSSDSVTAVNRAGALRLGATPGASEEAAAKPQHAVAEQRQDEAGGRGGHGGSVKFDLV